MNTQISSRESLPAPSLPPRRASFGSRLTSRQMMITLTACIALQMTSYVMILPLFARRFTELGAGVSALGLSAMAYALTATVAAPFMGALADRFGRRPVVLWSLAVYILAFTGYLLAPSAGIFILIRGLTGALTAGLMPAAAGMVADLAPTDRRAQWIGILSGGASIGWIAGPILGGMLFDRWGYAVALLASIGMAVLAFAIALVGVRETHAPRPAVSKGTITGGPKLELSWSAMRAALPVSLAPLLVVLFTYFAVMFAWAFIEPRFMFYAYDDLGWNSSMLGLMMSTYGIAMMLGEFGLSRLSDTLGRKPIIVAGLVLFSAQFLGLALSHNYIVIAVAFVIAGLGNALFDPALTASILDSVPSGYQARMLGVKSTFGSVGNILGPALVVIFASVLQAQGIFLLAAAIVFLMTLIVVLVPGAAKSGKKSLQPNAAASEVN